MNTHHRAALSAAILLSAACAFGAAAQERLVPIAEPDWDQVTGIAPKYFGPNTFQVPDMMDGTTSGKLRFELAGDWYGGFLVKGAQDNTYDIYARISVPLFTPRVNLNMWMPFCEWWNTSPEVVRERRASDPALKGHNPSVAIICLEGQVLTERKWRPDISVRVALRTASEGGAYQYARSYDSAGYFFDFSVGKSFGPVRLALSSGFLCWQTDNGRQNDAVMFGALARYDNEWVSASVQYGGYIGWEKYGDFPRVLKGRIDCCSRWPVHPFVSVQYGFNDWPFTGVRFGACADFSILGNDVGGKKCKKM